MEKAMLVVCSLSGPYGPHDPAFAQALVRCKCAPSETRMTSSTGSKGVWLMKN